MMNLPLMSRRQFTRALTTAAVSLSFFEHVLLSEALADIRLKRDLSNWLADLNSLFADLRTHKITGVEWQRRIEVLHKNYELADILKWIDFEKVKRAPTDLPLKGSDVHDVKLAKVEKFGSKIFMNQKGTSVPPHAHNALVSAHLVIHGQFHVRTFHRLRDEDGFLILKPSMDRVFSPGDVLSMSDDEDNVHWLVAKSAVSATFDTPIGFTPPGKTYASPANKYSMIFVDPTYGREGDLVRAKIISYEEVMEKFG